MGLILASGSQIRHAMLAAAGVEHRVLRPDVDEGVVKRQLDTAQDIAAELAAAKALAISQKHPEAWVIGSDSIIEVAGTLFDKPANREQAADHLRKLSGETMFLTSAVALARGGVVDWRHVETVELDVRSLSDDFVAGYLEAEWPEVGYCVGVFRMEARGVQLFSAIRGDHFTILGMPLLPLLGALRDRSVIPS